MYEIMGHGVFFTKQMHDTCMTQSSWLYCLFYFFFGWICGSGNSWSSKLLMYWYFPVVKDNFPIRSIDNGWYVCSTPRCGPMSTMLRQALLPAASSWSNIKARSGSRGCQSELFNLRKKHQKSPCVLRIYDLWYL